MGVEDDEITDEVDTSVRGNETEETTDLETETITADSEAVKQQQEEDRAKLEEVRAEIAQVGNQSGQVAQPELPKYTDRAGVPTRQMLQEDKAEQARQYLKDKSIFPTGRLDSFTRRLALLKRSMYAGLKGEGAKHNFDKVEPGKKIEMSIRGYRLSYQTNTLPGDLNQEIAGLVEDIKKIPGKEKVNFDLSQARLLEELEIDSPDGEQKLKLSDSAPEARIVMFPDDGKSRKQGGTFVLPDGKTIIITGDIRDPQFLVFLAHELGHQQNPSEAGNRSALHDPNLASDTESAKILKSERDASAWALRLLKPFIDSGTNRRLLSRKQTIRDLETCAATYSDRIFWLRVIRKGSAEPEKSHSQPADTREEYHLSIPQLIKNAEVFIDSIKRDPGRATDNLKYFCEFIAKEFDGIVFEQADLLGLDVTKVDTSEGKIRTFCFETIDEIDSDSSQLDPQSCVDRIEKIKEMIGGLEGDKSQISS